MASINEIIEKACSSGRKILDEVESKHILTEGGIATTDTRLATSRHQAIKIASELNFPVALKIISDEITHKSDAGGVKLALRNTTEVGAAYDEIMAAAKAAYPDAAIKGVSVQKMEAPGVEVIIGMSKDPQFGAILMFGAGGTLVELVKDVTFRITPLTPHDAHSMIRDIRTYPLLDGYRGAQRTNVSTLENMLLKVSALVTAHPQIKEMDLNPVFARPDGAVAVDARVILE